MKYIRPIIVIAIIIIAWTALYYFDKVYSSSEWLAGVEICTDIWQSTHNETLYYDCMNPLDHIEQKVYGAETNPASTVNEYIKEIKFQTCHVNFDIYNLSSYYRCIEL
jgi:hypothetical protein